MMDQYDDAVSRQGLLFVSKCQPVSGDIEDSSDNRAVRILTLRASVSGTQKCFALISCVPK